MTVEDFWLEVVAERANARKSERTNERTNERANARELLVFVINFSSVHCATLLYCIVQSCMCVPALQTKTCAFHTANRIEWAFYREHCAVLCTVLCAFVSAHKTTTVNGRIRPVLSLWEILTVRKIHAKFTYLFETELAGINEFRRQNRFIL